MQHLRLFAMAVAVAMLAVVVPVVSMPQAANAVTIGSVDMDGDSSFDSDSLADSTATQYRWHSYPGSRMTLNANQAADVKAPAGPIDNRLSAGLGGWFGTDVVNLNQILRTEMATWGGTATTAATRSTTWHPYKIDFDATYTTPSSTSISGYDFMKDANSTMIRVIEVDSSVNNEVVLSGAITGSGGGTWIGGSDKVVLVSDSDYYYAIHVVSLTGANLTPVQLLETASIGSGQWTYRKQFAGDGTLAVSIGIAAASEGSATAISRARNALSSDVLPQLESVKDDFDGWLQEVPAPSSWGISGVDAKGVTAAQHEAMYYSSWVFMLQNIVNVLPENSGTYPYPQMMAGKPSLWNLGSASAPGTAQWESVFNYQMLSFIDPATAWDAYLGLLSEVDGSGQIGGESLPTRLAQTAWILYGNSSNLTNLSTAYDDLERFLDWAEDNPRWICPCGYDIPEEKDMDFISSWMFDVEYAKLIADELGYASDVTMWENKQAAMIDNIETWGFFKDPDINYGVTFQYTAIPKVWVPGNDMFKAQALVIPGLPTEQLDRVKEFYMSIHDPDADLSNFHYHKYPNVSLILYGLLANGGHVQAEELANSALRDVIRGKQVGEALIPTATGVRVDSVAPSIFTAAEAIELTWLLNGMRYDSGTPTAFSFGNSTLDIPDHPDALPVVESFDDVSDWDNTYNSFISSTGGSAVIRYEDVVGGAVGYGMVEKHVLYDLEENPKLTIKVAGLWGGGAQWALKVNDGGTDITLQGNSSALGEFTYDLKTITGWSGTKSFSIRIYAVGGQVKVQQLSAIAHTLDTFDTSSGWDPWNATIEIAGGVAKITSTSSYGRIKKAFSYNVDQFPTLKMNVTDIGGGSAWALKVNDGGGDITLQADTSSTGTLVYDLKGITGWSGTKTFDIVLYAVNNPGAYFRVDYLNLPSHVVENFTAVSDWSTTTSTISTASGVATLTTTGSAGSAKKTIGVDVGRYTKLSVAITQVDSGATWTVKVNDGSGAVTLGTGTTSGTKTFDLAGITGWTSETTFDVVVEVSGGSGEFVKLDDIRISDL